MRVREFNTNKKSSKKGFYGFLESFFRKTRGLTFFFFFLTISALCILCSGLSAGIAISFYQHFSAEIKNPFFQGILLISAYFIFGISLIFIVPALNWILQLKKLVRPFRGGTYSLETIPWFIHNALIYTVRYSFLDFITPSPLNGLFYKMMGMKIGKGVIINTTNISDACLIELEDFVTIGGSAHLLTHYSQSGYLVISRLKIGKGTTVGLKATVFGDSEIGKGCLIKPHSVVLPKMIVNDGDKV